MTPKDHQFPVFLVAALLVSGLNTSRAEENCLLAPNARAPRQSLVLPHRPDFAEQMLASARRRANRRTAHPAAEARAGWSISSRGPSSITEAGAQRVKATTL